MSRGFFAKFHRSPSAEREPCGSLKERSGNQRVHFQATLAHHLLFNGNRAVISSALKAFDRDRRLHNSHGMRELSAFSSTEQAILLALRDAPGTVSDIVGQTKLDEETVKRALRFLEYQHYLLRDDKEIDWLLRPNPALMDELMKHSIVRE